MEWYNSFDFAQTEYLAMRMSNHTPMCLSFPSCPRPMNGFKFFDMWINDYAFTQIVKEATLKTKNKGHMNRLKMDNYLYSILSKEGAKMKGFKAVAPMIMEYYKGLLGRQKISRGRVDSKIIEFGPKLSTKQQIEMINSFNDDEIKQALFFIPNTKSPSLDDFSSGFFNAT
ncbi:hypothetical protein Cgig2_023342 [Carnegiea gigantea]|uniref:Uncharacterized protein n=1 Tax=Carnegiea gigantea TaxID=171969 RepID=A0A9Q1QCE3_9CARY|nr:hypothetical protein Cgig2_023342 [Carnegiea gigantea]